MNRIKQQKTNDSDWTKTATNKTKKKKKNTTIQLPTPAADRAQENQTTHRKTMWALAKFTYSVANNFQLCVCLFLLLVRMTAPNWTVVFHQNNLINVRKSAQICVRNKHTRTWLCSHTILHCTEITRNTLIQTKLATTTTTKKYLKKTIKVQINCFTHLFT